MGEEGWGVGDSSNSSSKSLPYLALLSQTLSFIYQMAPLFVYENPQNYIVFRENEKGKFTLQWTK
jgi:hypothetical protein